ncbi:hypothetical protein ZWY2020_026846 [Hordeum vulgare]|nr:hypothetical protein ZWY2020_026846 [Hordeum vulgare]
MDHMEALPDDAIAAILRCLPRKDLARCRRVCKAWLAIVDGRRLLRRNHHLPDMVEASSPTTAATTARTSSAAPPQHPGVDYGNLHFLPGYAGTTTRSSTTATGSSSTATATTSSVTA